MFTDNNRRFKVQVVELNQINF